MCAKNIGDDQMDLPINLVDEHIDMLIQVKTKRMVA
ncbi:unnamed protein product [Paramecium octaurelia]|uniref:Uncharacterized protein n=1 Tax=Paramecium octaurelia TaxID=43137 RepID=A0A8S1UQF8_PAROT|nr:unnamed protein product [Paramecium octaurelia]